ncbi:abortive infection protein [Corynebacterium lactis RW2-5]|uniref:Abortive infection protein n=2 Tax=Corynebacterium lactis TaxID=1231000 RepID=A0A0K2GXN5_9CORY|nr:abortive infection protein [Corynebacterium lactis RW2-5]
MGRITSRVLLPAALGAIGLFVAANSGAGSVGFYAATFFTAAVWLFSWLLAGRRDAFLGTYLQESVRGMALGLGLVAVFIVGAMGVRFIPALAAPVAELLANMGTSTVWLTLVTLVVNGIGEEMFFRDVAQGEFDRSMTPSMAIISQMALYIAVTAAMGVPLLFVAALLIGGFATMEVKRSSRLISASVMHVTWGIGMAFLLPVFIH